MTFPGRVCFLCLPGPWPVARVLNRVQLLLCAYSGTLRLPWPGSVLGPLDSVVTLMVACLQGHKEK